MFLLRQLPIRGASRTSAGFTFRKSTKLRNYVWSTISNYPHVSVLEPKIVNSCHKKVICCQYSNDISERSEVDRTLNEDGESAMTTEEIFGEIANGDPQLLRKLKLLQFEIEVLRQGDVFVPTYINKEQWLYMLDLKSVSARKKYITFLFKNEMRRIKGKERRKLKREKYIQAKADSPFDEFSYSLVYQTLFLRIYNKTLNQALFMRNLINRDIAQHFVFDCSFQEYMNPLNTRFCAVQLLYCLHLNLTHAYPSFIRLCNLRKDYELHKVLPKYIHNISDDFFPWEIHENSYLDFYPKEKLVYLTPHCNEQLMKLNPGDVYIIGAFVDKGCSVKGSLARAKKHNLRMAKFPIDAYLKWKQGTKSLPLNIVMKIMLDMKSSENWNIALKNVPRRHYEETDCIVDVKDTNDILV